MVTLNKIKLYGLYCLVLALWVGIYLASDWLFPSYISSKQVHETTENRTIEQVTQLPDEEWLTTGGFYQSFEGRSQNLWVRANVSNQTGINREWTVANISSWGIKAQYYEVKDGKARLIPIHMSSNLENSIFPRARFQLKAGESTTIYLHLKVDTISIVQLYVAPTIEFNEKISTLTAVIYMLIGAFFIIVLASALFAKITREKISAFYTGYQICVLFLVSAWDSRLLIPFPQTPTITWIVHSAHWVAVNLGCFFAVRFLMEFLSIKPSKLHLAFTRWALFSSVIPLFISIKLTAFCTGITLVSAIVLTVTIIFKHRRVDSVKFIMLGYFGLLITTVFSGLALYSQSIEPTYMSPFDVRLFALGALWEALFFGMAMFDKIRMLQLQNNNLTNILNGAAPHTDLNQFTESPYGRKFKYSSHEVTIVFVDIVGFSLIAQQLKSHQTFQRLADWLNDIYAIIVEYGGSVDRTLGDGFLCFFGYGTDDSKAHATKAFCAAAAIQKAAASRIANSGHREAFPVRIGINTAEVVIGNLGGQLRSDYTMIGEGVNFASRLESACNLFRIALSLKTKELIDQSVFEDKAMNSMLIRIKHNDNYIRAFEYDPFASNCDLIAQAEQKHFLGLKKDIGHTRVQAAGHSTILRCEFGDFEVLDFSQEGFGVVGDTLLGAKTKINMTIMVGRPDIQANIRDLMLENLNLEVRWSRRSEDRFKHGVAIVSLNSEQKKQLFEYLQTAAMSQDQAG